MEYTDVGLLMITYNQEKFIEDSINSILIQKTNFSVGFYIGDDCSEDETRKYCLLYKEKHPSLITLGFNETNIGFQSNFINSFLEVKSKYVAYLEGDDFWIDEYKLQKQFDFMEAHPDVAFCYTNAYSFIDGNKDIKEEMIINKPEQRIFDLDSYIHSGCFYMPTLTLFIRKAAFPDPVPTWLYNTFNLDWALCLLLLQKGKGAFIDEFTAMYRIHPGGIINSTKQIDKSKMGIKVAKDLNKHFHYKYNNYFKNTIHHYQYIVYCYLQDHKYFNAIQYFIKFYFVHLFRVKNNAYFFKTIYKIIFRKYNDF